MKSQKFLIFDGIRNRRFLTKKAITPLISTLLLLAFAVGLGTLVMSWGNSSQFKSSSCDEVSLDITLLDDSRQICLEGSIIKAVFENNGNTGIKDIEVVMLTSDSVLKNLITADIGPGEFKHLEFPADSPKILKIRLVPHTASEQCIGKKVEIEKIAECK